MEWLSPNAVVRASIIWRPKDDEPWLVSFDFAEIEGRIECVGMAMRSYIHQEAQDALGAYSSYLTGEVGRADLVPGRPSLPELKMTDPDSRAAYSKAIEEWEVAAPHPVLGDGDAVDALLHDSEPWTPTASPRPLRSTTVRELPLGDLLARVRRRVAEQWRSGVIAPRTLATAAEEDLASTAEDLEQRTWELLRAVRDGGWSDELIRRRDELATLFAELDKTAATNKLERFIKLTQEAASSFSAPGQKAGRPPHYSAAQLELIAKTYREAYRCGSSSPTKDVADKLGLTRSRAAKLIMRCRDPRVGLLAPTEKRKAGETRPSPSDRATDPAAGDS